MDPYIIPPLQIDPRTQPPLLLTSEPGSFAHNTLKVRVPGIIDDTIRMNHFPTQVHEAVDALRAEIAGGRIRPLLQDTPDREFWNVLSRDFLGRSWLDVPWYWAETYFYRRMLEATGYFGSGLMQGFDPYRAKKETELAPDVAPRAVANLLRSMDTAASRDMGVREQFEALLYSSLWGNRVDLSYDVSAHVGRGDKLEDERRYLLIDDAVRLWELMQISPRENVVLICDNAGTELSMDLAFVDYLLTRGLAQRVALHLKVQPFFVSDAMPADVEAALQALAASGDETRALAARLRAAQANGSLSLYAHWFYSTCLFYFQMPADLRAELARADLVILKGDANYRRLLGDAHWPPTTRFDHVTRYFPAPLVALRTLKAEEIVGLAEGQAEELTRADPQWMVNGRRGLVQARF